MSDFTLHPQLAADTLTLGNLPLCRVLLMNNAHVPWLILVPQRADIREATDLTTADQQQLWQEILHTQTVLQQLTGAEKMNIGALGNMVPQLHVHIIARNTGDAAWPNPVWGQLPPQPYAPEAAARFNQQLVEALNLTELAA